MNLQELIERYKQTARYWQQLADESERKGDWGHFSRFFDRACIYEKVAKELESIGQ